MGLVVIGWYLVRVNAFDGFIYRGGLFLLDLVCIVVIAVLVHPATRLSRVMAWGPLVWIGVRSYSLYLWHWPIFQVTRPDLDVPLSGMPLFVLRLALTFGAAELSFRYVETPLRQGALGNWWSGVRRSSPLRRAELRRRGSTIGGTFAVLVLLGWSVCTPMRRTPTGRRSSSPPPGRARRTCPKRCSTRHPTTTPLRRSRRTARRRLRLAPLVRPPRRLSRSPATPSRSVTR